MRWVVYFKVYAYAALLFECAFRFRIPDEADWRVLDVSISMESR